MSNSFKKTPIVGNTAKESEKKDKQFANRKHRRAIKMIARKIFMNIDIYEEILIPTKKELSNIWSFSKDGKQYIHKSETLFKNKKIRK